MPSESKQDQFEALLAYLKRNRGFDFTGYKRASLQRRIEKRMAVAGVQDFAAYVDYLEVHPEEFPALFNTILINVTAFFRDADNWDFLAKEVLPQIIALKSAEGPIRVWSAGCASGEEAYSLVMILAEALGPEAFRDRVKVYATDVDEDALAKARQGVYSADDVDEVPKELLEKYFEPSDGKFVFRKDLRRQVIFGRHDLIADAPISRVDLLLCRNTLMYLNAETQNRVLTRFHFAMNDGGVLFLGRAETLLSHANTFDPVDVKRRISRKTLRGTLSLRDRLLLLAQNGGDDMPSGVAQQLRLRDVATDSVPIAQLVVDVNGVLVSANDRARNLFGIPESDLGRPLRDLKISYRPVELRSLIDESTSEHRAVLVRDIEWPTLSESRWFELQVIPLRDGPTALGTSLTFTDVTILKRLHRELERAKAELGAAYEELQSTNEELETTNEELQSTVEELETTNEELQSTNEELETMNEELQSTNEELHGINAELEQREREVKRANAFLSAILTSMRGSVVVLDSTLQVLMWNKRSEDLWGLRENEVVGKHFLGLDIGLPVAELRGAIVDCLESGRDVSDTEIAATNRRGKPVRCRISLSRLGSHGEPDGIIIVIEQIDQQPLLRLAEK